MAVTAAADRGLAWYLHMMCSQALGTLQGARPELNGISVLRKVASENVAQGGWLLEESQGRFAGAPADQCGGFDSYEPSVDQVGFQACRRVWRCAALLLTHNVHLADRRRHCPHRPGSWQRPLPHTWQVTGCGTVGMGTLCTCCRPAAAGSQPAWLQKAANYPEHNALLPMACRPRCTLRSGQGAQHAHHDAAGSQHAADRPQAFERAPTGGLAAGGGSPV